MTNYTEHFTKLTPQSRIIPGKVMVQNNAGAYSFSVGIWEILDRFLILGVEDNTYYQEAKTLVVENAENVIRCIREDGKRVLLKIQEVSTDGLAPKNDPAIFALALCCTYGDQDTKNLAYAQITKVCRIGTHLFHFARDIQSLRGWSRGLRNGVAKYFKKENIAYDLIKYRQRDGWTHKDVLRLSHPKMKSKDEQNLARWILGRELTMSEMPPLIQHYELISKATDKQEVLKILTSDPNLPWETIPTEFLKDRDIWAKLLPHLPMTALIRNLGRMNSLGIAQSNLNLETKIITSKLTDQTAIKKSRIHPLTILNALKTYQMGKGLKGSLTWIPCPQVSLAMEQAFYMAFGNVEPTYLNWMLALDVSGSMTGNTIAGSSLAAFEATAALAMITARTEPNHDIVGFCQTVEHLGITAKDTLETALAKTYRSSFGSTDAAAAIKYAIDKHLEVDVFAIYTDNESWSGPAHATQMFETYKTKMGKPNTKLVVVGMTATEFSVCDAYDINQMNVVGFDVGALQAIRHFAMKR